MGSLTERNPSLWVATTPATAYPALGADASVDVAIVGAGITGLTAARLLAREGTRVAVVEAGRVCSGVTGYTTAKVTSLHTLLYADLLRRFGEERAAVYGAANQAAVAQVAALSRADGIECEWEELPALTYAEEAGRVPDIEAEVEAALRLGLPASFTTETDLPYPVRGAVRFDGQGQFHPRKYCLGLAEAIVRDGGTIYEQTRAVKVDDASHGCTVHTDRGAVRAAWVVLATHLPFPHAGAYFARAHPHRSYAMAVEVDGPGPRGMYISAEEPTRSVRPAGQWLIVGGEGHKVGQDPHTPRHYEALESFARQRFGARSVAHRWSAQDYKTADGIPYVGKMTSRSDRVLVATGFRKWGMTNGTAAAMILTDQILGRSNEWATAFDSTRLEPRRSITSLVKENADVAKRFVGDRLSRFHKPRTADELQPGEGGVVRVGGSRAAAYRDPAGRLHAVAPVCTHLGCDITFNPAETSWDCPCHGSRFDVEGRVIQGPAVKDLGVVAADDA